MPEFLPDPGYTEYLRKRHANDQAAPLASVPERVQQTPVDIEAERNERIHAKVEEFAALWLTESGEIVAQSTLQSLQQETIHAREQARVMPNVWHEPFAPGPGTR